MVNKERVETARVIAYKSGGAPVANSPVCDLYGSAVIQHPQFGMVAMRFDAIYPVDSPRPKQEWEGNWNTFIERCVKGIEEAARTA